MTERVVAVSGGFDPLAFGLSAFKQAAPRMFETAKNAGRLVGTSVEYTDNGRITAETRAADGDDDSGDSLDDDDITEDASSPLPPSAPRQVADVDPENRVDRGHGLGED